MKRITLIVPDTITRTIITAKDSYSEDLAVDQQIIIKALVNSEFNIHFHFPKGSVRVETVNPLYNA